jgi:hypothetical protein
VSATRHPRFTGQDRGMTQETPPHPQDEPRPETDRAPDDAPLDQQEIHQEAPGEADGPKQQARAMFASAFGSAGMTGDAERGQGPDASGTTGGYTGGMAAGDGGATGMRDIVAEEADAARRRGTDTESPANEAQADA